MDCSAARSASVRVGLQQRAQLCTLTKLLQRVRAGRLSLENFSVHDENWKSAENVFSLQGKFKSANSFHSQGRRFRCANDYGCGCVDCDRLRTKPLLSPTLQR